MQLQLRFPATPPLGQGETQGGVDVTDVQSTPPASEHTATTDTTKGNDATAKST